MEKLVHITSWQIGTTCTALKEGVTTEKKMLIGQMEAYTAWCVTWCVEDAYLAVSQCDNTTFLKC